MGCTDKQRAYYREWYAKNKERVLAQRKARFRDMPEPEVIPLPNGRSQAEQLRRDRLQAYIENLAIPHARKNDLVELILSYVSAVVTQHEREAQGE